mgnify:CR=1 FL=1
MNYLMHENFYSIQLFLDTTFFALILLYTFICIIYGIVKIGINFFGLEIYKIRRRDTMPQALSVVSILVILMMFAFSMQLMSIAPTYVTFGDQKLKKEGKMVRFTLSVNDAINQVMLIYIQLDVPVRYFYGLKHCSN